MQTQRKETSQLPLNGLQLSAVTMMKPRAGGSGGELRAGCKRSLLSSSAENLAAAPRSAAATHYDLRSADDVLTHKSRNGETQVPVQPWELRYMYSTRQATRKERATSVERVALSQAEKEQAVKKMHYEFAGRRTALLTGLPANCREEELNAFLQNFSCQIVSKIKESTATLLFPDTNTAKEQMLKLSVCFYERCKLSVSFGHPNSLLFVGNLSSAYTSDDLRRLFQSHGHILRCFIVCSLSTGLSKGYGFVEFESRDEASQAKLLLATKVVGSRSLRVDFADNGMQTCEDLHSQTLFVDRLPKGFTEDEMLRRLFAKCGTVNFCQVAVSPSGSSRGFAFIDMSTWQEAEEAQCTCNGASLSGYEIRVSFGMPCRPGACILQHKMPITLPFPVCARPLKTAAGLPQKENIPVEFTVDYLPQAPHKPCLQFALPPMTALYKPHAPPCSLSLRVPTSAISNFPTSTIPPFPASTIPPLPARTLPFLPTSLPPLSLPPLSPSCACRHSCNQHWSISEANTTVHVSRKRSAAEAEHVTSDPCGLLDGVYDQPYIGQHQQGLPFTHPLKRIKMEN